MNHFKPTHTATNNQHSNANKRKMVNNIEILTLSHMNIKKLPDLTEYIHLKILKLDNNLLEQIDGNNLPKSIVSLICNNNQITNIYNLPENLKYINLSFNKIKTIDELPLALETLMLQNNLLTKLPKLPSALKYLSIGYNYITKINNLPDGLQELHCYYNNITSINAFNKNITAIQCYGNKLNYLPYIHPSVKKITCHLNEFSDLLKFEKNDMAKINLLNKLHNFRKLFYTIKLKNKFKYWINKLQNKHTQV
jgi:hypothetical protein